MKSVGLLHSLCVSQHVSLATVNPLLQFEPDRHSRTYSILNSVAAKLLLSRISCLLCGQTNMFYGRPPTKLANRIQQILAFGYVSLEGLLGGFPGVILDHDSSLVVAFL